MSQLDTTASSSLSTSPLSPALRDLLPPTVAALLNSFTETAAVSGRTPLPNALAAVSTDDFKAFILALSNDADHSLDITTSGTRRRTKQQTLMAKASRKVTPSNASYFSLTSSSADPKRCTFDCEAFAYVHRTPSELGRQFRDAASPFFLLRAGRKSNLGQEDFAKVARRSGDSEQQRQQRQEKDDEVASRLGYRSDGVHELDPVVLAESDEGLYVVMYKQVKPGSRKVIELLHHLVLVDGGPGRGAALYFMPLDEEAMAETDSESAGTLHERRKAVMTKGYTVVSGKETGFLLFEPDAVGLTQARMVVSAEYSVEIDEKSGLRLLGKIFAPLHTAQQAFECCDWVDELKCQHFATVTMPNVPDPTADEVATIDGLLKYNVDDSQFQRVRGSLSKYPTVHMFVSQSTSRSSWGKCYGELDGSLEHVFAWIWLACSYERMQTHRTKNGGLLRQTDASENSRSQIVATEYRLAPNVANRWGETKYMWTKMQSGEIAVAFKPAVKGGADLFSRGAVEAKITGLYYFKEVAPHITRMTLLQTVDLGGSVPQWLMQVMVKSAFSLLLQAQEKYRRPDAVVDKEKREIIAAKIQSSVSGVLPGDEDAFDACMTIKKNFDDEETSHLVKMLKPPSPFVTYCMRPAQKADRNEHKRQVGTGKATAEVDTSAADAAAWIFDACSRDRMRINREDNLNLPRIITLEDGSNSIVMGTIKHAPFPLWDREFVIRMSWAKTGRDCICVWARSASDRVEYGIPNVRKVTGSTALVWEVVENRRDSCMVTLYQQADSAGWIPATSINKMIAGTLTVVSNLRAAFVCDELVDSQNSFATMTELDGGQLDEEEQGIFLSVAGLLSGGPDDTKAAVEGSVDHLVKVFRNLRPDVGLNHSSVSSKRRSSIVSKALVSEETVFDAEVVVDAGIKECVAWVLLKCSRQRTQSFFDDDGGVSRSEMTLSMRRRATTDVYLEKRKLGGLIVRREVFESVWRGSEDGSKYVVVEQRRRIGMESKQQSSDVTEIAFSSSVGEEKSGSISQTAITTKFILGRSSGLQIENNRAPVARTRHLSQLRKSFDKSLEIDRRRREYFCEIVRANREVYSGREKEIIEEGIRMFSHFVGQGAKAISMAPPTTKAKVAYVANNSRAWGWSSATVRATATEVFAFVWDPKKRASMYEDDLEKQLDDTPNDHNCLVYIKKRMPTVIDDRDFLSRTIWRETDSRSFEYVTLPEESEKRQRQEGVVRATYPCAMRIVRVAENETKLEYVIYPDSGGSIPGWVMNFYIAANLAYVTEIQTYFQRLRPLSSYDEKDGAAVGETFVLNSTEEKLRGLRTDKYQIRVSNVVRSHTALKEFSALHPWFPSLVEGMLSRRLRNVKFTSTKLENLSSKEALTIGRSFALTVFDRQVADAAVDLFINEHVSLVHLNRRQRFFAPMALAIGQRNLEHAAWGMIFKVGTGAVLGVLDFATDIYAIVNLTLLGKYGLARALTAIVVVCISVQVLLVFAKGKRRGMKHFAKEVFFVVSGFKPAVDALRVISGAKADVNDAFDPMFELIFMKVIEMVIESIPSALAQIYAILVSAGKVPPSSFLSITISIATISFVSTTICFDMDLDPKRRNHTPDFYGYVPSNSEKRTLVLASMFMFTLCHVGVRLLGMALLAVVGPVFVAAVLGGDMLLFLIIKLARNDLRYWLNLPELLSLVGSFLSRVVAKLLVDFTATVHARHPFDLGGMYWVSCLALGQATSFVAANLYSRLDADGDAKSSRDLWVILCVAEAGFVVFFGIFVSVIAKKFRVTFFSTMTGKKFSHVRFQRATDHEAKLAVFANHPSYFAEIRREVKAWVSDNYCTWIEDQPDWFTERVKESIPKDMIPESEEISSRSEGKSEV